MDVLIGYVAAVGSATLISREAMSEVSLSDIEEILRKEGRTQQVLPRIEDFAERFRDLAFSLRCIDFFLRAVVAVVMYEQLAGPEATTTAILAWLGALLTYLFIQDIVLRQLATAYAERFHPLVDAKLACHRLGFVFATAPLVFTRELFGRTRGSDDEDQTEDAEDEIMAALSLGSATGQIDEEQREMVESVFELGNSTVDRLMTPRTDMVAIDADSDVATASLRSRLAQSPPSV